MIPKSLLIFLVVLFVSDCSYGQRQRKFFRHDYSYLETTNGFYKIHTVGKTWQEAKKVCALEGASLFYPENDNEAHAVINHWTASQPFEWVYIGVSDLVVKGVFETIDGTPISDVYSNWGRGEPNDAGGVEDCVILRKDGTLNDDRCSNKYAFICKKNLQSLEWNANCNMPNLDYHLNEDLGRCYNFHATPMNWTDAYTVCSAEHSYLAVINSQAEADALVRLTEHSLRDKVHENHTESEPRAVHLGFHNRTNEGWQTVTGTPLDDSGYTVWAHHQPDGGPHERCGSMFYNGRLNDINCSTKCYFICEHEVDTFGSTSDDHDRFDPVTAGPSVL